MRLHSHLFYANCQCSNSVPGHMCPTCPVVNQNCEVIANWMILISTCRAQIRLHSRPLNFTRSAHSSRPFDTISLRCSYQRQPSDLIRSLIRREWICSHIRKKNETNIWADCVFGGKRRKKRLPLDLHWKCTVHINLPFGMTGTWLPFLITDSCMHLTALDAACPNK